MTQTYDPNAQEAKAKDREFKTSLTYLLYVQQTKARKGIKSLRTVLRDGCEAPYMGAGNQTWIFHKTSKCSWLPSPLRSPVRLSTNSTIRTERWDWRNGSAVEY